MLKRLDNFHPLTYKNDKKPEAERKPDTYIQPEFTRVGTFTRLLWTLKVWTLPKLFKRENLLFK